MSAWFGSDWLDPRKWTRRLAGPLNVLGSLGSAAGLAGLAGIVDGPLNELLAAAEGRRFEVVNGSLPVSGTIEGFEIQHSGLPLPRPAEGGLDLSARVSVALSAVTLGEIECPRAALAAHGLRMTGGARPTLLTGPLEIHAEIAVSSLERWLTDARIEVLEIGPGNRARVRHRRRRVGFEASLVPQAADRSVAFVIESLRVLRRQVRLPSGFGLAGLADARLAEGVRLQRVAIRDPHTAEVELRSDSHAVPLDLERLRSSLARAAEPAVFDIAAPQPSQS